MSVGDYIGETLRKLYKSTWANHDANLFHVVDGASQAYLSCNVEVKHITWYTKDRVKVLFKGYLPSAFVLDKIEDGSEIHVVLSACGLDEEYIPKKVMLKMLDCHVTRKRIEGLALLDPKIEPISLYVVMECQLEVVERNFANY